MRSLLLLLAGACAPLSPVIVTTATVPHLEPTTRTGAPLDGRVEVAGSASVITSARNDGDDSSLLVSRYHGGGEVRFRLGRDLDLDLVGGASSSSGILTRTRVGGVQVPGGLAVVPWELGVGMQVTRPLAPRWRLAFAAQLLVVDGGWRSVDHRAPPGQDETSGRDATVVASAAVILRWELARRLALFTSLTLRNQPTDGQWDGAYLCFDCQPAPLNPGGQITLGNVHAIGALGVELRVRPVTFALLCFASHGLPVHSSVAQGPAFLATAALSFR